MSPSEFELRTALRHGEGERPDPDALLAAGRARASARRTRILAGAGAVVVVLAVGTTGGILLSRGGNDPSPAGQGPAQQTSAADAPNKAVPGPQSAGAPAGSGPTSAAGPRAGAAAGAAECPSAFGIQGLGGSVRNSHADDPLLPTGSASVLVCGYGSSESGATVTPGEKVLGGAQATALVSSLNAAPSSKPHTMCSMLRVAEDRRYAFVPITSHGAGAPVFTTLGNPTCQVVVTGATGTRYAWAPPPELASVLATVTSK